MPTKPSTTSQALSSDESAVVGEPGQEQAARIYTRKVNLLSGPMSVRFVTRNRVISRTIKIRGDQTLQELHAAIFAAFDRWDDHMYEFQFGKRPMDPAGLRYGLPGSFDNEVGRGRPAAGRVDQTRIESLGLEVGRSFGYWFDFGDDWWHQIDVEAIDGKLPRGKLPKVVERVGRSPPQYCDE